MAYYVLNDDDCRYESMTKEQILAAIAEVTGSTPTSIDDAFITKVKEQNAGAALKFWLGTRAEYNALSSTSEDVYYIIKGETYALSDHAHGNLSNDGKIGSSGGYIVETGDGGSLKANRRIVVAGTDPSQVTDLSVGDIYIYISDGSAESADDVINAMLGV